MNPNAHSFQWNPRGQQQQHQHADDYGTSRGGYHHAHMDQSNLNSDEFYSGGGYDDNAEAYDVGKAGGYYHDSNLDHYSNYNTTSSSSGLDMVHAQAQHSAGGGEGFYDSSSSINHQGYHGSMEMESAMMMSGAPQDGNAGMTMGIPMSEVSAAAEITPPGSFYPLTQPYMPHIQSAPISALAIDPAFDALYVAGHTVTLNKKRRHATYSTPSAPIGGSDSSNINNGSKGFSRATSSGSAITSSSSSSPTDQKVSMLATHSFPDGMLYSAVAAHHEARFEVLDGVSSALYGESCGRGDNNSSNIQSAAAATAAKQHKIPKHAYRPPFNRPEHNQHAALMMAATVPYQQQQRLTNTMGITKILPFSSTTTTTIHNDNSKTEGYLCTVSPSSVRVHSRGGLLLSESKIEGLITGTFHPGAYTDGSYDDTSIASSATHITAGGIGHLNSPNLYCMDLYSSTLKTVASHTVRSSINSSESCCITDIATSHETGNIVAGCSDGTIRIFDGSWRGGNYMECARVKAHGGGVANVAVSGNLICTTGYSSRSGYNSSKSLYAFPDEHVLIFDIRYLGRGGIAHPFSGLNGGPRFVSFLPPDQDESGESVNRILVGSGQVDGGLQIITPFQGLMNNDSDVSNFVKPLLDPEESITAMQVVGKDMAIGTSLGNIQQYRMATKSKTVPKRDSIDSNSTSMYVADGGVSHQKNINDFETVSETKKSQLPVPSYEPDPPQLSIEPHVLTTHYPYNDSTPHSIFNSYVLQNEPRSSSVVDEMGKPNPYSFGILTNSVVKQSSKRLLSKQLLDLIASQENKDDFLISLPTAKLQLDLGLHNETQLPNSNKLLHGNKFSSVCYNTEADPRKKDKRNHRGKKFGQDGQLPQRYICKNRPLNSRFSAFDFAKLNDTIYPGWDYVGPNSYACPVLLLLFFVPEIRNAMLHSQLRNIDFVIAGKKTGKADSLLCTELGFLFHQINCLASHAMVYPKPPGDKQDPCRTILGAFVPSNFLSLFMTMPEASALALLDGNPAATEVERRPEAFYRFLLHHLDKELNASSSSKRQGSGRNPKQKSNKMNLIDSLYGMDAVSMNEFLNKRAGSPSITVTRSNTVDLAYDAFISKGEESLSLPSFGELLRFSLCKDVPLRAWCDTTKSFETVVQRKIVTSLPTIMSLSCACAGVNGEDRLPVWRKTEDTHDHWLPERIEVEIEDDGNVITRQLRGKEWEEFRGEGLPEAITKKVKEATVGLEKGKRHARYQLEAILTFVNVDGIDCKDERGGHHVLHLRVPKSHRRENLLSQLEVTKKHLSAMSDSDFQRHLTLITDVTPQDLEKRIKLVEQKLEQCDDGESTDEWVLFNGPNVSSTVIEDALAFHVSFKEPCIITYRQIDDNEEVKTFTPPIVDIPSGIITSPRQPDISGMCDLVAFDAEFVQVQHENSILTATGSKMVLREGRNALGRMSLIDCRTGRTIIDDHVLPREPIVDYLTRFSGIKPTDLNPKTSPHNLISSKHAYLKMRYLVDRGCIFVGHGLISDFLTVNIFVPPSQIIDTTDIFHLERRRLISLRFLVNYLLGKDMQQDVHDSIEDSIAARLLYMKALELKEQGIFDKVLHEIYDCGQRIDWKVGEL